MEHLRPEASPYPVVDRIAQKSRAGEDGEQPVRVELRHRNRGERSGGEEQRVARQKRENDQARLAEHDQKKNPVKPQAVLRSEKLKVPVNVQNEIGKCSDKLHKIKTYGKYF